MKKIFAFIVVSLTGYQAAHSQANVFLSNLSPTSVNQDLLPNTSCARNLGSSARAWKNLYLCSNVYLGGGRFLSFGPSVTNSFTGFNSGLNAATAYYNTGSGYYSLYNDTTGDFNTASGYLAMYRTTAGAENAAVGAYALYSNTLGNNNTALGSRSMFFNQTGSNNTSVGYQSMYSNTGSNNTAGGHQSMFNNTTGTGNTANGYQALYTNKTGFGNTASGSSALYSNTSSYNTSQGYYSLNRNTSGSSNTASGYYALWQNSRASYNTGIGMYTLFYDSTTSYNTAIGYGAGDFTSNPTQCTFVGANTGANSMQSVYTNSTALGYGAKVTASNQIMLGNSAVSVVRTFGSIIWASDGRFKKNVKENVGGLEFIKQLRPVTYNYDVKGMDALTKGKETARDRVVSNDEANLNEEAVNQKEKKIYSGFIAQEVEETAKKVGYDFSGVYTPQNEKDIYGLSYTEFVVPLVRAVQELSKQNEEMAKEMAEMKETLRLLTAEKSVKTTTQLSDAQLEQNVPNPFGTVTKISYRLPKAFGTAQMVITDASGKTIKQVSLAKGGEGVVSLDGTRLSAGTYSYTITVDGKPMQTKKMVLIK
jgi:hypothetical protein